MGLQYTLCCGTNIEVFWHIVDSLLLRLCHLEDFLYIDINRCLKTAMPNMYYDCKTILLLKGLNVLFENV